MVTNDALVQLGRLVAERRTLLGLSKESASRLAGISSITWKRVEDGLRIRDANYPAVATALGWPAASINAYLIGGDEPQPEELPADDLIINAPGPVIERMLEAVKSEHPDFIYRWAARVVAERRGSDSATKRNGGTAV